jgi:glutamate formiminotransferase/formiminotetrahydrofolate cyclodeaminase
MVAREAARHGARAVSSEIVGLVPQRALDACAEHYLQLESFTPRQILENRLEEAGALVGASAASEELIDRIASATPAPGGGSAAALAGALAAALGEMVSRLTAGNKKFGDVEPRMRELAEQLRTSRVLMRSLADQDASAYDAVVAARRLPKATAEETRARDTAIAAATQRATEVPLRTARAAAETISCLEELATRGNPNLISDAATGCQIAFAALKGAEYNVRINIAGSSDAFAEACRRELAALVEAAAESLQRIDALTS